MPAQAPYIFVSTGTLVPATPVLTGIPRPLKWPLYIPHWLGRVPSPDRFLADSAYAPLKRLQRKHCWVEPLVDLGLAGRDESVAAAKRALRQMISRCEAEGVRPRIILVGQSQGGLVVTDLALDPEFAPYIVACVMAGTPFRGSPATRSRWLRWSKVFNGVAEMEPGHPSLASLRRRTASRWPAHIVPVLVADSGDELVPWKSALGVSFPAGVRPRVYNVGDTLRDGVYADTQHRPAHTRAGLHHLWMCRQPEGVVGIVKELMEEFTAEPVPAVAAAA